MNIATRTIALTTACAAIGAPLALVASSPAQADVDRSVRCDGGRAEISVDRERGRFEVQADLDNARPGQRWTVVLRHDGKRFAKVSRTTDRDGELEVERMRRNTSGADRFEVVFRKAGSSTTCTTSVTVR